jgi:hypothetical protein
MAQEVRDTSGDENDVVAMAARVVGTGQRRDVFKAIYFGKRRIKTAAEIAEATGLSQKRVTECGKALVRRHIVEQRKQDGMVAYEKVEAYIALKDKILRLTDNPEALAALPTKTNPKIQIKLPKFVRLPTRGATALPITIDDVDNFRLVRFVGHGASLPASVSEEQFKLGVQAILGQAGKFKDWGGENSDLFSTHLRIAGTREAAAFAFKGPGERGKLVPGRMGKNGDQIQRMFQQDATVFFVQHWREIDSSVLTEMRAHAVAKSIQNGGQTIRYGIISGQDSERLRQAYPRAFGLGV